MRKIKYLLLLFAGIISTGSSQAQWNIESCPTKNKLNAISFADLNSGWIVGEMGIMLYSSGSDWKEYDKLTNEDLNSVFMINKNDGWIVGDNGTIFHFNGKTWESCADLTKNDLFSVSFQDSKQGIAVGAFGTILIYKNGFWNSIESGIRGSLYSVYYKKDEAWIGGGLECVKVPLMKLGINKTENLPVFSNDSYATIRSIVFLCPDAGWAVGSPSTLLHFDGQQWENSSINDDYSSLNSVFFSEENNGISVGYGGTILIYSGYEWRKEKIMTNQNLNGATIIKNKYYAVGDNGTIISGDLGSYDIQNEPSSESLRRIEVYPNPCKEFLNVAITIENDNLTGSISICKISGEIIMQKELRLSTKSLTYTFLTSNLKNGLYLIKITIEGKTTTCKFVKRH